MVHIAYNITLVKFTGILLFFINYGKELKLRREPLTNAP